MPLEGEGKTGKASENGVVIVPMRPSDAPLVWSIQTAAFEVESARYGGVRLPPLQETPVEIADWLDDTHLGLVAKANNLVVGSIRIVVEGNVLHLMRLSVALDWQRQGIGAALLATAEGIRPAQQARLFTGNLSAPGLALYHRAGYREVGRELDGDQIELVHLVKQLGPKR